MTYYENSKALFAPGLPFKYNALIAQHQLAPGDPNRVVRKALRMASYRRRL